MSFLGTVFLIASPFLVSIGFFYLVFTVGLFAWILPVLACVMGIRFNKARKARQNTGRPEIDDRGWEVKRRKSE